MDTGGGEKFNIRPAEILAEINAVVYAPRFT